MLTIKFREFWQQLDCDVKHEHMKNKAIEVNRNRKKMDKATKAEFEFDGCRKGARGGKRTTLQARSVNATKTYDESLDVLLYMVKNLYL